MSELFSERNKGNKPMPYFLPIIIKGGLKIFIIVTVILMSLFDISEAITEKEDKKEEKPVVITSDKLSADNIKHTALFEGNVIAKTEDMTIYSDRMVVYYTENGEKMDRIEASGNVKVLKGERTIVSKEATYYAEEEKVVFKGDPQAWEGDNKVTGTVITYFVKDERSIVENSKVVIINKKGKETKK